MKVTKLHNKEHIQQNMSMHAIRSKCVFVLKLKTYLRAYVDGVELPNYYSLILGLLHFHFCNCRRNGR